MEDWLLASQLYPIDGEWTDGGGNRASSIKSNPAYHVEWNPTVSMSINVQQDATTHSLFYL